MTDPSSQVRRELEGLHRLGVIDADGLRRACDYLESHRAEVFGWLDSCASVGECADLVLEMLRV